MKGTTEELMLWLLATARRSNPRPWDETEAMLARAFPDGVDDDKLDRALVMAGEVLEGKRDLRWGLA